MLMIARVCTLAISAWIAVCPLLAAQSTTRVSVAVGGSQPNAASNHSVVSADGLRVVFESDAANLVAGDSNNTADIFQMDRSTGAIIRVSVSSSNVQANQACRNPSTSADGGIIAFSSWASSLTAQPLNGMNPSIFVRNVSTGMTELISLNNAGQSEPGNSEYPVVSGNGRFVAFLSYSGLDGQGGSGWKVFVRDRQLNTTVRANRDISGGVSTAGVVVDAKAAISFDGRFVAFASVASDLVSSDTNGLSDVFLRDMVLGATQLVSVSGIGAQGDAESPGYPPSGRSFAMSSNGRYIAFESRAGNLVGSDSNGMKDVFVRDTLLGSTDIVSVGLSGLPANGSSTDPTISDDGAVVAFTSEASNLVGADTNALHDIFVANRTAGQVLRASVATMGAQTQAFSSRPSVSGDGRYISFSSTDGSLVSGDNNGFSDIFLRDWYCNCHVDQDGDGHGSGPVQLIARVCPAPLVPNSDDCDDSNAARFPGAPELCDGLDNDCDGQIDEGFISTYCTAGTSVHGCSALIAGVGTPSSSAGSGFNIVVSNVPGQRYGTIFYGFYPANVPWAPNSPSYRCVSFPIQRMGNLPTHGSTNQCNGDLTIDFNAWYAANPGTLGSPFVAGQVFYAQGWYRDPAAPKQTNLSNGLRFTLCN